MYVLDPSPMAKELARQNIREMRNVLTGFSGFPVIWGPTPFANLDWLLQPSFRETLNRLNILERYL